MGGIDKKMIVRVILAAWVIIWAVFLIRPFFAKGILTEYSVLLKLSSEGKRAYVTGPRLYEFIKFCKTFLKSRSTYKVIGVEDLSLDHRRVRYYLYPNLENRSADFILVYKVKDFQQSGYKMFKILDSERYILKKAL